MRAEPLDSQRAASERSNGIPIRVQHHPTSFEPLDLPHNSHGPSAKNTIRVLEKASHAASHVPAVSLSPNQSLDQRDASKARSAQSTSAKKLRRVTAFVSGKLPILNPWIAPFFP
ncbi:hypothetical protein SESBI_06740 [Sesbania bispinosa]|nr:hypothetical protein SESBI_06740 [Sesbania bispinosa]